MSRYRRGFDELGNALRQRERDRNPEPFVMDNCAMCIGADDCTADVHRDECPKAPREPLVLSVRAQGRYVYITSYKDGATDIKTTILFKRPEDADECARVLSAARRP